MWGLSIVGSLNPGNGLLETITRKQYFLNGYMTLSFAKKLCTDMSS